MSVKTKINSLFGQRFNRWLTKRMPPSAQHQLNRRNIFIMPSKFGVVYLLFVMVLFLLATNYQNNAIMLLSYLMASLFISAMMQSFFNFSGLVFEASGQSRGYARQAMSLVVKVSAAKQCFALRFSFDGHKQIYLLSTADQQIDVEVPFMSDSRGVFKPGRVKVMSEYSLGLFTTWSRLDFDCVCIVYPEPRPPSKGITALSAQQSDANYTPGGAMIDGVEDFYQLKTYVHGEPLSGVAWKQFARGQGKFSKQYQQPLGDQVWLKLSDMQGTAIELKLQHLCFIIRQYGQRQQTFGLDLGNKKIAPDNGSEHITLCLTALAQFGLAKSASRQA